MQPPDRKAGNGFFAEHHLGADRTRAAAAQGNDGRQGRGTSRQGDRQGGPHVVGQAVQGQSTRGAKGVVGSG
jgi:hypothetical protein